MSLTDIIATIVEHPPITMGEELCIREGVDAALDEWRSLRDGGKDAIARIQMDERARTGINSLKVGYNRVFGYFIEVTNSNAHLVPEDYQRRQTLTGAERYVTPALKEHEEKVLTAAERIEEREHELFEALRRRIRAQIRRLQCAAQITAELDVVSTFAEVAEREGYVRPVMTDGFDLESSAGRHPVVERMMAREKFIPNDIQLTRRREDDHPDRAEHVRQVDDPAADRSDRPDGADRKLRSGGAARIGVVDRLFTRVGASDNLVRGQSTFMVEMSETSAILHTATEKSLVLLDEIGRGTSTYDGVSIAWSVSEYLHDEVKCKTVFATHYHELTQLTDELVAACNYSVEVREVGRRVLFLHRLVAVGQIGRMASRSGGWRGFRAVLATGEETARAVRGRADRIGAGTGHAAERRTQSPAGREANSQRRISSVSSARCHIRSSMSFEEAGSGCDDPTRGVDTSRSAREPCKAGVDYRDVDETDCLLLILRRFVGWLPEGTKDADQFVFGSRPETRRTAGDAEQGPSVQVSAFPLSKKVQANVTLRVYIDKEGQIVSESTQVAESRAIPLSILRR